MKKTPLEEYENVRKTGLAAIALRDDDELIEVKTTDNEKEIILVTKFGQCIRFKENDVRTTGRVSMGVRGINLLDGDEVVGMQICTQETISLSYPKTAWANGRRWQSLPYSSAAARVSNAIRLPKRPET